MTIDVQAWLRTHIHAICAPPVAVAATCAAGLPGVTTRLQYITHTVYPILLRAGYELPLNIVVDLTCLYLDGPDMEFRRPPTWPTDDPALADRYCRSLNGDTARGPLREAVTAARRVLRQHLLEAEQRQRLKAEAQDDPMLLRPGETRATMGLLTFLELMAAGLYRHATLMPLLDEVRTACVQGHCIVPSQHGPYDQQAVQCLRTFLQALVPENQGNRPQLFGQAFQEEARVLLTVASAQVAMGAEGLDLPVLQACLTYRPLVLTGIQEARYRRLRQTLSPRQNRSARSPECGNHGITTKGNPTAVLRSYLARDDFVERVYLKQVLYFDRYAAQQEPHRVLLVWILDRGPAMQVRTPTGQRRDAVARQLAAYLLEDAVRYCKDVPALEVQVAVVLHNSSQQSLRGRLIVPPPELLHQVPSVEAGSTATPRIWLPKVDGFLPHYFLREPIWPAVDGDGDQRHPFARTSPDLSPTQQVLEVLVRLVGQADYDPVETGGTYGYSLCHVAVFGPMEALPLDVKERTESVRCLSRLAARASVSYFACDKESIVWTPWPPPAHAQPACLEEKYGDVRLGSRIRSESWDNLLAQMETL